MKLYLAELVIQHSAWAAVALRSRGLPHRLLLSYWFFKDENIDRMLRTWFREPYPEIFADSGAFSAMTQGVKITVEDYAAWLEKWQHRFTAYANLDVIKNAELTWANQQQLEARGLRPVPAFHVLEDWGWLDRYLERYPYIALGVAGMQGRAEAVLRWAATCFDKAAGRAVFHGFGLTGWRILTAVPWYSVDSSSWSAGVMYGRLPLFDRRTGKFVVAAQGDPASCYKHAAVFREYGYDPGLFADRARVTRADVCGVCAVSYAAAEDYITKRHGPVAIPAGAEVAA